MDAETAAGEQTASREEGGFPADLLVALDRSGARNLSLQLEHALREAIRDRRLAAGTALPASRMLAAQLGVARSVVVGAYGQLVAEGYLEARQGSGTRVARLHDAAGPRGREREPWRPLAPHLLAGRPDPASFPRSLWQRHYRAVLAEVPDSEFGYPEPAGALQLRTALTEYLGRVRAVKADPERMLICGGFTQGLTIVCRALRARGAERIGIEDPCFTYHRQLIAHTGLEPVPLAVDDHGLDSSMLAQADVQGVLVAPAHSFPRGAVLSPARRSEILDWAARSGGLVIEDDYDAEFRYDRAPVGALQGLAPESVVYGGSASKTLSPATRVGWLVAPGSLIEALRREKFLDDLSTSALEQLALARLIDRGDLARHLHRMRPVYRRRRDAALRALARQLPEATVKGVAAGLHLYVELPEGCDEARLVAAARERGVILQGAARSWADPRTASPALVLGYASAAEPSIERGIEVLGTAFREIYGPHPTR